MLGMTERDSWDFTHVLMSAVGLSDSVRNKLLELFRHGALRHLDMPAWCVYGKAKDVKKKQTGKTGSGRMAQEYVKPKRLQPLEDNCMGDAESLSFMLTVNLNLDEVQCITCVLKHQLSYISEIKLCGACQSGRWVRGKKTLRCCLKLTTVTLHS